MALSLLRTTESPIPHVIFGKLPNRPDFVRVNATHPIATEMDEYIQSAMEQLRAQEDWEERYDFAPVLDFCYPSRDQKWVMVGSMMSSCDQSNRRYPLVAGIVVPSQVIGGDRRLLPIACEIYFEALREQLSTAIDNSAEALACRQYLETQTAAWTKNANDLPLAGEIVKRFMDTHHPRVLETPLSEKHPAGTFAQALLNIGFYRDFLRRFATPSAIQVIELPLLGSRAEAALNASAWLGLLTALSGSSEPWTGGFLLRQGRDSAMLYPAFGRMSERALLVALGGEIRQDCRLDLTVEQKTWQAHPLYAETSYAMDRVLADPDLTISNLNAFLKDVGQKLSLLNTQ